MVRSATEKSNAFYLGVAAWIAACGWLLSQDLGSIAFVASALLAIWFFGLRDKFQGEDGDSAYSVFNKGGRAILGGFTGEQFDQQMRGGMTHANSNTKSTTNSSDAPLTTTGTSVSSKLSDGEKLKRRSAAAAAAERRFQQQQNAERDGELDISARPRR